MYRFVHCEKKPFSISLTLRTFCEKRLTSYYPHSMSFLRKKAFSVLSSFSELLSMRRQKLHFAIPHTIRFFTINAPPGRFFVHREKKPFSISLTLRTFCEKRLTSYYPHSLSFFAQEGFRRKKADLEKKDLIKKY